MLAIWSLVPLPFLKPAWTSGSSRFTYCWSLAWMKISLNKKKCMFPFVQSHQDDSSHHSLVADCLPLLHPPQMPCLFSSLQLQAKSYLTLRTQFFPGKSSMSAQGCSGAPSNMFPLFPHLFAVKWWDRMPWSSFLMLSFKPAFSLSSFTFIERLFSSSLSTTRVVTLYIRLLIFLPTVLIPAWASSSPEFCMMYSA